MPTISHWQLLHDTERKRRDYIYEKESTIFLAKKIEHFLRCESKTIKSKVLSYCEILIYINDCMHKKNKKQCRKGIFETSNLHNKCRLNKFPISGPAYRGEVVIHGLNTIRAISCKARNSPVEHPDWEYIFDSHSSGNQYHHYFSL